MKKLLLCFFLVSASVLSAHAQQVNRQAALTTTITVQAAALTHLYGYYVYNPNATACSLDLFNTGTVVLGTTVPYISLVIPATSAANLWVPGGLVFASALSEAAVTAAGGASTCATGMTVNLFYQ